MEGYVKVLVAQSCPKGRSLPGSSVHGIIQARIEEWVTISFSRGSSWPRDQTRISCIVGGLLTIWAIKEAPMEGYISYLTPPFYLISLNKYLNKFANVKILLNYWEYICVHFIINPTFLYAQIVYIKEFLKWKICDCLPRQFCWSRASILKPPGATTLKNCLCGCWN